LRHGFIAAQVALALVLLTGATMLVRGFAELFQRDLGWQPAGLVSAELSLSPARYNDAEQVRTFHRSLLARLNEAPGVTRAAISSQLPFTSYWGGQAVVSPDAPDQPAIHPWSVIVTPEYFETLEIRVLEGHTFAPQTRPEDSPGVVLNASLARRLFADRSAVGQRVGFPGSGGVTWHEVIGVVADATLVASPGATAVPLVVHQPAVRVPIRYFNIAVRGPDATGLREVLRQAVAALDPELAVRNLQTVSGLVARELGNLRSVGRALAVFALLGLGLTALGLYAVTTDLVNQRRSEFGIRLALGAQRRDVFALVLRRAAVVTLAGLAAGFAGALAVATFLASLLPNLVAASPGFLATIGAIVAGVVLLATVIPARRATRADPLAALRAE
jgi:predicted permease